MSKRFLLLIWYLLGLLATIGGAGGDAEELIHDWEVMGNDDSRGAGPRLSARFLLMSSLRGVRAPANNSTIPFCFPYPQRAIYPTMSALVAKITLAADEILKGFLVEESSAQNQSLLRKSLDHGVQHSRSRALPRDATKEWPILSISQQ